MVKTQSETMAVTREQHWMANDDAFDLSGYEALSSPKSTIGCIIVKSSWHFPFSKQVTAETVSKTDNLHLLFANFDGNGNGLSAYTFVPFVFSLLSLSKILKHLSEMGQVMRNIAAYCIVTKHNSLPPTHFT